MTTRDHQVRELISQFQELFPPVHSLDLGFRDCACRLYSNAPPLLDKLRLHYHGCIAGRASPELLITLLQTPPFLLDDAYDIKLAGRRGPTIGGDAVDDLDGRLIHNRECGMLALLDSNRFLIMGPGLEKTSVIIDFIYGVYHLWLCRKLRQSQSAPCPQLP